MAFPDPATFFKALGVDMFIILIIGGVVYWSLVGIKKINPDFKFWFKYHILRRKHDEQVVAFLMDDLDNDVSNEDLVQGLILGNTATPNEANEMLYIYKELKKLKGGIKNE